MDRIGQRFLAAATLVAAASIPAIASAQPFGARLSLFDDPTTTVAVSWNSPSAGDDRVVWGTSPASLSTTTMAELHFDIGGDLGHSFTAKLTGLAPGTTYYYRVGNGSGSLHPATGEAPFSFRTMSADRCDPFRVMVIGDNRADTDNVGPNPLWSDILAEAMPHMPDVFVNTGDMVKNGERNTEWANFVDASEPGFAAVPSIVTMGNHDEDDVNGDDALYNRLFELPRNSRTDTEDYYSIDVGPIHFVSLNTQFTRPGTTELADMIAWLEADLAAATLPWKVVFFHKAVYTRGNHHTGEENDGTINASFVPIFDRHDVDLVFNGHSHDYERFAPSTGVDAEFGGSGRSFPAGNGSAVRGMAMLPDGATATTYVVTGGAGALTTDVFGFTCLDAACTFCTGFNINCPDEVFDNDRGGTVVYDGRHNFVVLEVDGGTIRAEVWATDAGNSGGAERIDSFAIADSTWTGSICAGTMPMDDGGVPGLDGGTAGTDAGGGGGDGGVVPGRDAGTTRDAGGGGTRSPSSDGGCCNVPGTAGRHDGAIAGTIALLALALARARRRRVSRRRP